jgi:dGTPase
LKRFLKNNFNELEESLKFKDSVPLEGQIVSISDEIAQKHHDLDDGLRE